MAHVLAVMVLLLGIILGGCSHVPAFPDNRPSGKPARVGPALDNAPVDRSLVGPGKRIPDPRGPVEDNAAKAATEPLFKETACKGSCVDIALGTVDDYPFARRYLESIGRRIVLNVVHPWETIEKGAEGEVEIHARVDRKGTLVSKEIYRGSGKPQLDQAALNSIFAAAPFNPLPPSPYLQALGFKVWFKYHQ